MTKYTLKYIMYLSASLVFLIFFNISVSKYLFKFAFSELGGSEKNTWMSYTVHKLFSQT